MSRAATNLDIVLRALQSALRVTDEQLSPLDQDVVYRALLDHVRARRPESVGFLSQLPDAEAPNVDPRSVRVGVEPAA